MNETLRIFLKSKRELKGTMNTMALKFIVEAETATTAYVTKQQRTEIFVFSNSANKSISYQKTIKRYLSTN